MKRDFKITSMLAAMAAGAMAVPVQAQVAGVPLEQEPNSCMRECLENYVEAYLQAMSDGTPSNDLFAADVRFTENGVRMPFGTEGLWATTSSAQGYRLIVPDVVTGQVAALVTVQEQATSSATGPMGEAQPVGVSLRLRINEDGLISEVEQIAARPERPIGPNAGPPTSPFPATGKAVEDMGAPNPAYMEAVPEAQRHTRAELVEMANAYFEAVERNTGEEYYPFTDDCIRYENGIVTAGPEGSGARAGCTDQLKTSLIGAVNSIRDRRIVAVDQERGVVFAFGFFDHRNINWTWQLGELFKVDQGNISHIEAIFIRGPYGMCSGWSTYEQCRSEQPQDVR